jgi:hypothetical protein
MMAFQKFDPEAYRSTLVRPVAPAKPAKPANVDRTPRDLSSFSNFSRASSPTRESWSAADWQAYFEERAAIREFDGRLPRVGAERLAFDDTVAHWLSAHPTSASDVEQCAHCGYRTRGELLPVLASGGHVWVHNKCWSDWYAARTREAVAAVGAMLMKHEPACDAELATGFREKTE